MFTNNSPSLNFLTDILKDILKFKEEGARRLSQNLLIREKNKYKGGILAKR
jgi:hypothetical protein